MAKRYAAVIRCQHSCPDCDEMDAGDGNRADCGCLEDHIVGESDSLAAARMMAAKQARRRRNETPPANGTWLVLDSDNDEEIVASSDWR